MVAIETRFLGQTETKPSRIVASTCNGQRLVVSKDAVDQFVHQDDAHRRVPEMLRDKKFNV